MPRQYVGKIRFAGSDKVAALNPAQNVDRQMMKHEHVVKAIDQMRENVWMLSISVACGLACVTLGQFEQPAEAPLSWLFDKDYPVELPEGTEGSDDRKQT